MPRPSTPIPKISAKRQEDFASKWMPEPNSGCWLWLAPSSDGYGKFQVGRRSQNAHRVSWTIHRGPIPVNIHVLHHCDTKACVNPDHLFLGSHHDNMVDRFTKYWKRQIAEGRVLPQPSLGRLKAEQAAS